jgi:transposase-like protein
MRFEFMSKDDLITRRTFTDSEKREIVSDLFNSKDSVSAIARKHRISASLLFQWRKKYAPIQSQTALALSAPQPQVDSSREKFYLDRIAKLEKALVESVLRAV